MHHDTKGRQGLWLKAGVHDRTRYSGTRQRETRTIRHMRVIGNRWKQSGIRDNVRPMTHEEG